MGGMTTTKHLGFRMENQTAIRLTETRQRLSWIQERERELHGLLGAALFSGDDPTALRTERRALREEAEDLHALLSQLEIDVHNAMQAVRLEIARAEQRRIPLLREREGLHARRAELYRRGLDFATHRQPSAGTPGDISACEGAIGALDQEIADMDQEIAALIARVRPIEEANAGRGAVAA
jgi:hypothetical protein